MLKLTDYFQPLNFQTLSYFILLFVFFDVLGSFLKKFIVSSNNDESRILSWIIGLGFFVFVCFIIGFFVPPKGVAILCVITVLSAISLPSYIKRKQYLGLIKSIWDLKVPVLLIIPFLPAVFVKASLPPYYSDEMAYHFMSPSDINHLGVWIFNGGLYQNVPRLFDTFFTVIFSITRTYSIVRLFHFSIMSTSIIFAYSYLRKNFGFLAGLVFVLAFFCIPDDIIFVSTLGYVDIATISFMLIGYLSIINFVLKENRDSLFLAAIFWGMALGTKYTPLTALSALIVPVIYFMIKEKSRFSKILKPRIIIMVASILLIFGGYWYIKNFIVYGNPTYPLLFPCTRYASEWCGQASKFFGDWTMKVTFANFKPIMQSLFPNSKVLIASILILPFLFLLGKNTKIKKVSIILIVAIFLEFVMLKYTSGFYARYHQHLQLLFLLLLAIQFGNVYKNNLVKLSVIIALVILIIFIGKNYINQIKYYNSLKFLNWTEIDYSIGKLDIYGWLKVKLPGTVDVLRWCESPPGGTPVAIARFDPDMIWYANVGLMRSFFINCYFGDPDISTKDVAHFDEVVKERKLRFWTITANSCVEQSKIQNGREINDPNNDLSQLAILLEMRRLNNAIVCNSQKVLPILYYFDYSKLPE